MQRTLMQYYKKENQREVIQALIAAHREDLIGSRGDCLVPADAQYLRQQREKRETMAQTASFRGKHGGKSHGAGKKSSVSRRKK